MFEFLSAAYDIFLIITQVSFGATGITMMTPTNSRDAVKNGLLKVLNFAAGNTGKNKNADDHG